MYSHKNESSSDDKSILNNIFFSTKELLAALTSQGVPIRVEGMNLHVGQHLVRGVQIPASLQTSNECPLMSQLAALLERISVLEGKLSNFRTPTTPSSTFGGLSPQSEQNKAPAYSEASSRAADPFKVAFESSYREKSASHSDIMSIHGKNRNCSTCGASLAPRAIFCAKCGSNVRT